MAKNNQNHKIIKLAEYTKPSFSINNVNLQFELNPTNTIVNSKLSIKRTGNHNLPLQLNGENLNLISVALNDEILDPSNYNVNENTLTIENVPDKFTLSITNTIAPKNNTQLQGLYLSEGIYCTQCEAEGFRRITYFLDRPDVMSIYQVTIIAPENFSAVLSNGNLISDEINNGKRICTWSDPHAKPCYLFALVAGTMGVIKDQFQTINNQSVSLYIYLPKGYENRGQYAMNALKRSMLWDEKRFNLEYDLNIFNIVAIEDFNMGAMENKSLNIFNAKYVLADPQSATDMDYAFIESIIAHEYFHNWSGNRVTCRDWFQLSLKEGLTVFRDQEFSSDENSRSVVRILDVMRLRDSQFPEDASKLSHPVRPPQYIEINNFYTATVYEKGAEVVRLLHSLLGESGFQKGLALYFKKYDGQAVTCDDFISAMRQANNQELAGFDLWYSQSGTPRINTEESYNQDSQEYHLKISQHTKPTADCKEKHALIIPLEFALLNSKGESLAIHSKNTENIKHIEGRDFIILTQETHEFTFTQLKCQPQLSLNRGFSAPVIIETPASENKLSFHTSYDNDTFIKWDCLQNYSLQILKKLIENNHYNVPENHPQYLYAIENILKNAHDDRAYTSLLLALPQETYIGEQLQKIDVNAINQARSNLKLIIAQQFSQQLNELYQQLNNNEPYLPNIQQMGQRALRNLALSYITASLNEDSQKIALRHYQNANNMTDKVAALQILADTEQQPQQIAFQDFYKQWQNDPIVLDKWFAIQARSHSENAMQNINNLAQHKDFNIKNPNRLRSLVASFAFGNTLKFNQQNGSGYDFTLNILSKLDAINPQTCARLLNAFSTCDRLIEPTKNIAHQKLNQFKNNNNLSKDSSEIINKILSERQIK